MIQGSYISEDTNSLIRRARQTLEGVPVLNLENLQASTYTLGDATIRHLAPSCNRIEVKNIITVTNASIVKCTAPETVTCESIPTTCSTIAPGDYINIVAIVSALADQTDVTIRFEYIENDVPSYTDVTVDLSTGNNTIYAWTPNHQPSAGYTLVLYGARIL